MSETVKPRIIKRQTMVELLGAVYEHHGWKRAEGESRATRVQALYEITADVAKDRFIAKPKAQTNSVDTAV